MGDALKTDLYELNMAASYLALGMNETATFSLFARNLPDGRGFLVAAGLEDCVSYLEGFAFEETDLNYLSSIGFGREALERFGEMRFTGDVWAVPEGTIVFANEPMLEVTAPIAEAQIVETFLLNQCTFQTSLATKAARCRIAADSRIELVDFSLRRTHGIEASIAVARVSAIAGFAGTSNVAAASEYGLRPSGTMAHSYVEAFDDELEAFLAFGREFADQAVFLVDTYDSLSGVQHAIMAIKQLGLEHRAGVRLDSGNLVDLARSTRALLDAAGLTEVKILVSGGLDEYDLARIVADRAPIDAAGIGTRLGVSADAPYLDTAYKLVEYAGRPVVKLSAGKATLPGPKQIHRACDMSDTIALRDEKLPESSVALLEHVMGDGRRLEPKESLEVLRSRLDSQISQLPAAARSTRAPIAPVAKTSDALRALERTTRSTALDIARH